MDAALPDRVADLCKTAFGPDAHVRALTPLPGGAENHAFSLDVDLGDGQPTLPAILKLFSHGAKAAKHETDVSLGLRALGFPAGEILHVELEASVLGLPCCLMRRIEGETLGRRMRGANDEQAQSFLRQFAELLARLHGVDCTRFADAKTGTDVEACLDAELAWYGQTLEGLEVPVFQPVWQWLRAQRKQLKPIRASLTHNDYHPYNVMVDRDGRLHLLDWTLARVTDPRSDLAQTFQLFTAAGYGASRTPITAAYEAAAGYRLEPMDFFDVFAALKHAAGQFAVLDDGKNKRPVLWARLSKRPGWEERVAQITTASAELSYRMIVERSGVRLPEVEAVFARYAGRSSGG
jgi:aminoglycoside phosphotransferase (APT) family kinase protein